MSEVKQMRQTSIDMATLTPVKLQLIDAFERNAPESEIRALFAELHSVKLASKPIDFINGSIRLMRSWMWTDTWAHFPIGKVEREARIDKLSKLSQYHRSQALKLDREIQNLCL